MLRRYTKLTSLVLLAVFVGSAVGLGLQSVRAESAPEPVSQGVPTSFATQDEIVDPRGQTVKEEEQIHLSRETVLNLIKPFQWVLDVKGFKVIQVNVPIDLALSLGIDFPLNVETSYNPYDVRSGYTVPFVVDVDNDGCTPSAKIGVDFKMETSKLNFNIAELGNLLNFAVNFDNIEYSNSITIPFFGVETKFGSWLSYDIINKYYTLEDIIGVNTDNYGISGGIGVNLNYEIKSWVTAKAEITGTDNDKVVYLRWDETGKQLVPVGVNPSLEHGDHFQIEVGDWVYHIAHDVTFTIWADIGLEVIGLQLIDQTFDWSYTLPLGELTFPEKNDYTFVSYPEVLAGKSVKGVSADFNVLNFGYDVNGGGQIGAVGHNVAIPENAELKKWFSNMNVDAGIGASVDIKFPFNMRSYYNQYKATSGNMVDYHLLVDSVDAGNPAITYNVAGYVDLSKVSIFGMALDRYDLSFGGDIFKMDNFDTPFGISTYEYEVTKLVKLDLASKKLNDYISSVAYGINPDIQFRAWAVLQFDAYLTGQIEVSSNGQIVKVTEFKWDEQFDTETARILIDAAANANDEISITVKNLEYHMKVTPGLKLGVTVLGGIIGFDYTFLIPWSFDTPVFKAPDFTDKIVVQSYSVAATDMVIPDDVIENPGLTVSGSFILTNTGTIDDTYSIALDTSNLPAGSSAVISGNTALARKGGSSTISWTVTLGANAHSAELYKNNIAFKISSANIKGVSISKRITILPDPTFASSEIKIEKELAVTPGVGVIVPVKIMNTGQIGLQYTFSFNGAAAQYVSWTGTNPISVAAGKSTTLNLKVDVPALSTIVPQTLALNVGIAYNVYSVAMSENAAMNLNIQPFTAPQMGLNVESEGVASVEMGKNAEYAFKLKNAGNVNDQVKVTLVSEKASEYKLNNGVANSDLTTTLNPGQELPVSAKVVFNTPGYHNYTVIAENDKGVFYTQTFDVFVQQVAVSCDAETYNWNGDAIVYTVKVKNVGSVNDEFKISVDGLDKSAYSISNNADDWFYLPGGDAERTFTLTFNPSDVTKVPAGANGFRILVESKAYQYQDDREYSGVKVKEIYNFVIPETNIVKLDSADYYDISFKILNQGNVDDTFTVVIEGVEGLYYEIVNEDVIATAVGTTNLKVARGESKDVTVRIYKTSTGKYTPTLKVLNSKGEAVVTVEGAFGEDNKLGMIWVYILVAAGGFAVVAGGAAAVVAKRTHRTDSDRLYSGRVSSRSKFSGAFDGIKSKFGEMKENISTRIANRKVVEEEPGFETVKDTPTKIGQWKEEPKRVSKDHSWDDDSSDGWN